VLVGVSLHFMDVEMEQVDTFEALTLDAYIEGLRDAG